MSERLARQAYPKLLIVDDKPQNIYALEKLLAALEINVMSATSGFQALELTLEHEFCLAIVDIQMPEMDGYELVELLRGNPTTANLPVIFVSAIYSDEYHHRKGYDAGAVDFLSKPFVPEILLSKVQVFLDLYNQQLTLKEMAAQNARLYEVEKKLRSVEQARAQDLAALNASKDRFFSIVSHDLRTPFNGLIGNAQLLQLMLAENQIEGEITEVAEAIFSSAQSAHRLLENLLSWSLIQRGIMESRPDTIPLAQIIQSTAEIFAPNAALKGIQLSVSVAEGLVAYADPDMFKTILRNLLSNAIKFTPVGGRVSISARSQLRYDLPAPEFIEVLVADTGVGIMESDLEKLCKIDAHFTTIGTAKEEGAGLGLILCQEMVEFNQGKLWLESAPGKGTTATFTVPVPPA
ncbi:MAG: hybrid sensor histidine kinase/response regulator [Anaerolineae bacterium]|nr:hybrid sensor histidine kinase/response regulator [Anaerolineae bacterium]